MGGKAPFLPRKCLVEGSCVSLLPLSDRRLCSQVLGSPVMIHTQRTNYRRVHHLIASVAWTDGFTYRLRRISSGFSLK